MDEDARTRLAIVARRLLEIHSNSSSRAEAVTQALGLDPTAFACDATAAATADTAAIPNGARRRASFRCVACFASRLSASLTVSERHLGRSAAHFLERTVSFLMSGIGVHWMPLNMAMITISSEGEMTEAERARTSLVKSSKIPLCG